jgi:predicted GNAT family acetyltransferase
MSAPTASPITDNADRSRFEMEADGQLAVLNYRREGELLHLTHTEVPAEAEGQGIGGALVRGVLEQARRDGRQVVPLCGFVHAWVQRNPEFRDVVATP